MNKAQYLPLRQMPPLRPAPIAPVRALARLALALWTVAALSGAIWGLMQNPLAHPFTERTTQAARSALERALAEAATPDELTTRLTAAVAAQDRDRIRLLLDLAQDRHIALSEALRTGAEAALARDWTETAGACARCTVDVAACPSLTLIGACTLPFQISPAGDVAALGQAGWAWASGQPVDGLDAALAAVGLAATGATIASGGLGAGATLPVKVGASALRIARRAKALSPGLSRALREAASEAGGTARLSTMAGDVTRIAKATSPAEVLPILRLADDEADLSRLARLSEVAGPETPRALEMLGKARSLRLLHRLGDAAIMALGGLMALIGQLGALLGAGLSAMLRRGLRQAAR
uniref:hypothetical protein n=1 Tax=Paenirhodobacter enshiensis TaxID=1105367 RepID=UPI0035B4539B